MATIKQNLSIKQKALIINLDPSIYGTFSEIGAGQETVRHFFRAGGASGTIAKAMSAYDKDFSDSIYGKEADNRYVSQNRLKKMLLHEQNLIEERLSRSEHQGKRFFSYANTVTTINFTKTYKGHGWVGVRFQHEAEQDYSEIILHVRFKENDATQQQETLGCLGGNLIYGAFFMAHNPRELIKSLYDDISLDRLEIDSINFSGPAFEYVDNRLMSLLLVQLGTTNAAVFSPEGKNLLPADVLYKSNIFAIRGSFRPVTKVNIDMLNNGLKQFMRDYDCTAENTRVLFEITISNLCATGDLDERDFLDRVDVLAKLGYTIIISNFSEYYRLIDYFSSYTREKIGVAMGVNNMLNVFNENYYNDLSGGILEAFGKFFKKDTRVYLYPYRQPENNQMLTAHNLRVGPVLKELYLYFKINRMIVDIENFDYGVLGIYSRDVLSKISQGLIGWEDDLPEGVADMIKERGLFGYKSYCELK
jgi:hypothetical protein